MSPLDLIPDVIPGIGLLDDLGVVGMVFNQVVRLGGYVGVSYAVIKVVRLTKAKIQEAVREKNKEATSATIKTILKTGDFNTIDVGLYNRDSIKIDEMKFEAVSLSDEIEEGMVITI